MWSGFKLSARPPVWIAGISVCLLAASGVVAIFRSIPPSYAGVPDQGTVSEHAAPADATADPRANDPRLPLVVTLPTINRRSGASCSECGVVTSIRETERSEVLGRQDTMGVKVAERVAGGAIATNPTTRKNYEITVRFRDGSTAVFNEADPRTWRLGARVIMLGRSMASN